MTDPSARSLQRVSSACNDLLDVIEAFCKQKLTGSTSENLVQLVAECNAPLAMLTDERLSEFVRRLTEDQEPDSFPTKSGGEGGRGGQTSTAVEVASLMPLDNFDSDDAGRLRAGWRAQDDPQRRSVTMIDRYLIMARISLSAAWDYLLTEDNPAAKRSLKTAKRQLMVVDRERLNIEHIGDRRRRRDITVSPCMACEETVSNVGHDTIKSGLCPADYTAWGEAPRESDGSRADRMLWIGRRRREIQEAAEIEALQNERSLPKASGS